MVDRTAYISGQIGMDPEVQDDSHKRSYIVLSCIFSLLQTKELVSDDVVEQTKQVSSRFPLIREHVILL